MHLVGFIVKKIACLVVPSDDFSPGTSDTATAEEVVKCLVCKNFPMYSTF